MKQLVLIINTEKTEDLPKLLNHFAGILIHDIGVQGDLPNCMGPNENLNRTKYSFDYDVSKTKEDHASIANFMDNL